MTSSRGTPAVASSRAAESAASWPGVFFFVLAWLVLGGCVRYLDGHANGQIPDGPRSEHLTLDQMPSRDVSLPDHRGNDQALPLARVITIAGTICGSAVDGDAVTVAAFGRFYFAAEEPSTGKIFVADEMNSLIRVLDNGRVTTVAGTVAGFADGNALAVAMFQLPHGLFPLPNGNVYVADEGNNRIRLVSGGVVTSFAGNGIYGFIDGDALTGAEFGAPHGILLDNQGKMYVADAGNNCIRMVSGGQVSTFAGTEAAGSVDGAALMTARFQDPVGLAFDAAGDIYVADRYNHQIRKIAGGQVSTVAGTGVGGFADGDALTEARFMYPTGVAVDEAGDLIIADGGDPYQAAGNHRIRRISSGRVSTLAGGTDGLLDGPLLQAQFSFPAHVSVTRNGDILVADSFNCRLRLI